MLLFKITIKRLQIGEPNGGGCYYKQSEKQATCTKEKRRRRRRNQPHAAHRSRIRTEILCVVKIYMRNDTKEIRRNEWRREAAECGGKD